MLHEKCSYSPMARQERAARPWEIEYEALDKVKCSIRLAVASLKGMYPTANTPDFIEAAMSDGEAMADNVYRRMTALDTLGDEA